MRTSVGDMDGNEWEKYAQKLLRMKYEADRYQEVPARFGGDLGLEGYTLNGKCFQCYCADGDPPEAELYEYQRDKMTGDIGKFLRNELEIAKLLVDKKVTEWHLVTPRYSHKRLLDHAATKRREVLASGKSHVHPDFVVLITVEEDFLKERALLLAFAQYKVCPDFRDVQQDEIDGWRKANQAYYNTLERKLEQLVPDPTTRHSLITKTIKDYIQGQNILEWINRHYPDQYEKVLRLKSAEESRIQTLSATSQGRGGELLRDALLRYEDALTRQTNSTIEVASATRLANEAIADWLIGCSLSF